MLDWILYVDLKKREECEVGQSLQIDGLTFWSSRASPASVFARHPSYATLLAF